MPAGHMAPSYSIRVRDREQWNTWVNRGDVSHQRRVTRWGKWKTWRVARNASAALTFLDEMHKRHPISDVGVFFGGKRLTVAQLHARALVCPVCRVGFPSIDLTPGSYTPNHGDAAGDEPCDGVGEILVLWG